jgi:hypothetical protein
MNDPTLPMPRIWTRPDNGGPFEYRFASSASCAHVEANRTVGPPQIWSRDPKHVSRVLARHSERHRRMCCISNQLGEISPITVLELKCSEVEMRIRLEVVIEPQGTIRKAK